MFRFRQKRSRAEIEDGPKVKHLHRHRELSCQVPPKLHGSGRGPDDDLLDGYERMRTRYQFHRLVDLLRNPVEEFLTPLLVARGDLFHRLRNEPVQVQLTAKREG